MKTIITQIIVSCQGEGPTAGTPVLLIRVGNCNLECHWCFVDGTQIRTKTDSKNISEIVIGDTILGVNLPNTKDTMKTIDLTKVLNINSRLEHVWKLILIDGTELIGTKDHPILINNGYRPMFRNLGKLKPGVKVYKLQDCGYGIINDDYKKGWLAGYWNGDGSFYTQIRPNKKTLQNKCRSISIDEEINERNFEFCHDLGVNVRVVKHKSSRSFKTGGHYCNAITSTSDSVTLKLKAIVNTDIDSHDWYRGYIAGIFDAEGSFDGNSLRIAQLTNQKTINRIKNCLEKLNIKFSQKDEGFNICCGKFAAQYFDKYLNCVCKRKFEKFLPLGINACEQIEVESVKYIGKERVFNLTTESSTFIANDILVHNCDTKWSNNLSYKEIRPFNRKNNVKLPFIVNENNIDDFIYFLNDNFLNKYRINTVLITGGEPLMNKQFVGSLIYNKVSNLININRIEIETNGTLLNDKNDYLLFYHWEKILQLNISPKLNPKYYRSEKIKTLDDIIILFDNNRMESLDKIVRDTPTTINWKFVYDKSAEDDIDSFIAQVRNVNNVYIMPLTPDYTKYKSEIKFLEAFRKSTYDALDYCMRTGYILSPRQHVWIFNNFKMRNEYMDVRK